MLWALIALAWILLTTYGSYSIRANWFVDSKNNTGRNEVALTFDDGPDPLTTPLILDLLREHGIQASFFLIGRKAEQYPGLVRQIAAEGHTIGNHSWSHSAMIGFFSKARLEDDVFACSRKLEEITGERVTLFRPPFGVTNPRYRRVLEALGLKPVGWTLRSYDTVIRNGPRLAAELERKLRPGQIILLHDTVPETAEALPLLIRSCRERGIGFVRLTGEATGDSPAESGSIG